MTVSAGPIDEIRRHMDEVLVKPGLTAKDRISKLNFFRSELLSLTGVAESYIGDLELVREAEAGSQGELVREAYENADLRAMMIERGVATPDELDSLGMWSHIELDRLKEEGRLIEALGMLAKWLPEFHPRGRGGMFRRTFHTQPQPQQGPPKGRPGGVSAVRHKPEPKPPTPPKPPGEKAAHAVERAAPKTPSPPKPSAHAPTPEKPAEKPKPDLVTDNPDEALRALGEGKTVELAQPEQLSTLISKLHDVVTEMEAKGEKAPDYDLCKVTVKGTSIFCTETKGVPRAQMPQLLGTPAPGSKADKLPRTERGSVDLADEFRKHLESKGAKIERDNMQVSHMKATQRELVGSKVAGIMKRLKGGQRPDWAPYLVSKEGYIIDGHHRWAAEVGLDYEDGHADWPVTVDKVDMSIVDLLRESHRFTADHGLQQKPGVTEFGKALGMESPGGYEMQLEKVKPPDSYTDIAWGAGAEGIDLEEIQKDLALAEKIGLNDWPEKGDVANRVLGDHKDTEAKFAVMVNMGTAEEPKMEPVYHDQARLRLHEQIIDALLRKRKEITLPDGNKVEVPDPEGEYLLPTADGKPRVLFFGGGTASGKSTALKMDENKHVRPPDAVEIDVDQIKSMLPEFNEMVAGGDKYAASGVHEESSWLGKLLQERAMERGLNVIVDGTGDSPMKPGSEGKFVSKMQKFKDKGYDVSAFYVSAPTDVAIIRAAKRATEDGRWVPIPEIKSIHKGVSERWANEVVQALSTGLISEVRGYDTRGGKPHPMFGPRTQGVETQELRHLDEEGRFVVFDEHLYDEFVNKQQEQVKK